ncbi:MAG: rod shape-determining protein MreC [Prosthecobacter sp.]|jgi:rod shape-determining protein MreC|uniref:rod shape-determining protein MreC n=1 Tax=Prosthecobacter sp. TaxID=1965333 RepID=UPI0019EB0DEE|nr:rod shape-determining protein MreC [Prosthecobacter sp.]MBE2285381.1 rod shape-determining protein MreC [Prosthecobacter sp.]
MKKLNILALLVFVAGLVAVFTLDTSTTRQIQARVMSLLSPFIHSSAAMEQAAESAVAPQLNVNELKRENEEQRVQLERLRIIQQKYNQTIEENAKLRQLIEFKQAAPFKMTAAKVIRRSSSTWWNSLIIDKGSLDGIGTDSPVITSVGLVGKTSTLAPHMTKVILLTDEMCRVSAKVEGTLEQGILAGERAALEVRPELHLRFLSRNANINAGAGVYSSGEGGVFPGDLLLGRVKRFENREISGEAIIEPAVDFSTLDHVFVIEMQAVEAAPEPGQAPKDKP